MLNREDMLELTRRMNLSRNCFFRIAGSYRDKEGIDEGSFNTSFVNYSAIELPEHLICGACAP
jgi:hypothetical protein